jgi:hypothetical protein
MGWDGGRFCLLLGRVEDGASFSLAVAVRSSRSKCLVCQCCDMPQNRTNVRPLSLSSPGSSKDFMDMDVGADASAVTGSAHGSQRRQAHRLTGSQLLGGSTCCPCSSCISLLARPAQRPSGTLWRKLRGGIATDFSRVAVILTQYHLTSKPDKSF